VRQILAVLLLGALTLGPVTTHSAVPPDSDATPAAHAVTMGIPSIAGTSGTSEPDPGSRGLPLRTETAPVFRHDEVSFGSLLWRAVWGLVVIAALAFGVAFVAKRFVPGVRGYSSGGRQRIEILESRRVTPRLTLHVVAFENREILLAQSGDQLLALQERTRNASSADGPDNA